MSDTKLILRLERELEEIERSQRESATIRRAYLHEKACRETAEREITALQIAKDNLELRLDRCRWASEMSHDVVQSNWQVY